MRHGADEHARGRHHRIEARAFAIAQILRGIPDTSREAGASLRAIGGEPHVGQEHFAVPPLAFALDIRANVAAAVLAMQHLVRIGRNGSPARPAVLAVEAEQPSRRLIRE